jgi:serine/threonine protein kinase
MNPDVLCMGCMSDTNAANVCPFCGYRNHGPVEETVQLSPRTLLKNRYVIGKVLGQGGFGITYLAYDLEQNQKLAIKEYFPAVISTRARDRVAVTPTSNKNKNELENGVAKFGEEARSLSQFKDHPGVVPMLDFFRANGTGYIVMGYMEGCDFKQFLNDKGGRIPFPEALKILAPVMGALEELHKVHVLHRDISPDNIYVEKNGNVRILDFGATRYAMGEQSRSLSVILKPGYAPEEQYRSRGRQGAWTDIYALGATFYRGITGQVPPPAMDRAELDELIPPKQIGVEIPEDSETALLKALAVRAENRFQTVVEFRNAITPREVIPSVKISTKVFLSLLVAAFLALFLLNDSDAGLQTIVLLPLATLFVLMIVLFAQMWKPIQDGHARTTPQKAVALSFIPLFNLYWAFPVFWGFTVDYNRFLRRHSASGTKLSQPLFLATTITYVLSWFVVIGTWHLYWELILLDSMLLLVTVAQICAAVNTLGPSRQSPPPPPPQPRGFALCCILGEYQGLNIQLGDQAIVIGRNPAHSNLILSSDEISGKHVKVWMDSSSGGVWIEDLHSTNGTFYRHASGEDWVRLSGSKLLGAGDHFRLSNAEAEFELRPA